MVKAETYRAKTIARGREEEEQEEEGEEEQEEEEQEEGLECFHY